jgi:hypothetical protein
MSFRWMIFIVVSLFFCADAAASLRCGTRIVKEGDRDFAVSERCGTPYWSDVYYGVDVIDRGSRMERQREVQWTVWYYNFGPKALLRGLVFRDGVLQHIESFGYGVNEIGTSCHANSPFTGMSVGELVARCGEPASRREYRDSVVYRPDPRIEKWRDQRREEWIYDFGDSRLLRVLRLDNGRVISSDSMAR